jgi:hypothetical protein
LPRLLEAAVLLSVGVAAIVKRRNEAKKKKAATSTS